MVRRHNNKGRSKRGGQFVPLPYFMLRHDAWRGLSGNAIKVFLELRSRYTVRGDSSNNNGELTLSLDEGARLLGMGKTTVHHALRELEQAGFIVKTKQGHWYGRKASEFRVTTERYRNDPPSKDWQKRPCKK
jgi:biotin operon repressor